LAVVPVVIGGAAAWWIAGVARFCASLHLPVIGVGAGLVGALVMTALLVVGVIAVRTRDVWVARVPSVVRDHRRESIAIVVATAVALWVLVPRVSRWLDGWPPYGWAAVACDVGQGDGLVLSTTPHHGIVVDAGPDPASIDRCLRDIGVRTVDFVVLTHFHADHVEGLSGVLHDRRVGYVVVTGLADPPEEVARVAALARRGHVPLRTVVAGWHGVAGAVSWEAMWPQRYIKGQGSDPNNASIVLLVRAHGVSLLLTGDVEPAAQQAIESSWLAPHVDVLKVPHHGSSHQDAEFAAWSGARLALISVGAGNPYGHPAPATLAALAARHVITARTDLDGDIAVVSTPNGPALVRRRRSRVARSRT